MARRSHTIEEYLALQGEEERWLIEPILPKGGILLVYGRPKQGKSFLALQLAGAVASDAREHLGFKVHHNGPVLYIQIDTPRGENIKRLRDLGDLGLPNLRDLYSLDRMDIHPLNLQGEGATFILREMAQIGREVGEHGPIGEPILVVLDTMRESFEGSMNDDANLKAALGHLIQATTGASIIIVTHDRKPGRKREEENDDVIYDVRGSGYLAGKADTILKVTKSGIRFEGRAVGMTRIYMDRTESYFWKQKENQKFPVTPELVRRIQEKDVSVREKARELSMVTGISEEAARSRLRRK